MVSRPKGVQKATFWDKLLNPLDLESAFICVVMFLRIGGLFPYKQGPQGFEISYPSYAVTLVHCFLYAYANITLVLMDPMQLAKPIIVDSALGVGANLLIRMLGIVITVAVFLPILTNMGYFASVLNRYLLLTTLLEELGIKSKQLFKQILGASAIATLAVFLVCLYLLGTTYFFYERISNEKASGWYLYAVILANFYQNMSLFSMGSYSVTTYLYLNLLNRFLKDLLKRQIKESEPWVRRFKK